jgi:very-short-patch-repair endonuclease
MERTSSEIRIPSGTAPGRRRRTPRASEGLIHEVARRQHGVITRAQLIEAGFTPRMVWRRLEQQRLTAIHRGVYVLGPLTAPHTREMAAILACGGETWVSHGTAGGVWNIGPPPGPSIPVEVTVLGRSISRPGIQAYRVAELAASEQTEWNGIPITTPARTLLDLAGALGREARVRELEQAVARAERNGLTSREEWLALAARHPRRRGSHLLRSLVETPGGPAMTRSEAEDRLLALIRRARLPSPQVNELVAGYEVDFAWRAFGLVVEVDGFAFHSAQRRFDGDRRRDGDLVAAGYRVIRVTWRHITREPEAVLARIARAMGSRPSG